MNPGDLIDDYRIDALVGQGGMGQVFRATHLAEQQPVAIKTMFQEDAQDTRLQQRMLLEARSLTAVHHPNVVEVSSVGQLADQRVYLVLEWLDGEPLSKLQERSGRLERLDALSILGWQSNCCPTRFRSSPGSFSDKRAPCFPSGSSAPKLYSPQATRLRSSPS